MEIKRIRRKEVEGASKEKRTSDIIRSGILGRIDGLRVDRLG